MDASTLAKRIGARIEEPADSPDMKALNDAKAPTENYKITDRVFYQTTLRHPVDSPLQGMS